MEMSPGSVLLVTGGSGFLGRRFLDACARRHPGACLRVLVHRRPVPDPPPATTLVTGALEDRDAMIEAARGVTSVVHFAAVTHASRPEPYFSVNAHGTRNLVEAARKGGATRFVLVSSRAASAACGDYGLSKLQAEEAVRESGLPFVILRFAEVYGPGSSEGLNALISLVRRFPVVPYPGGRFAFAPLAAEDAVKPILEVLERDEALNQAYTIAGPESLDIRAVLRLIQVAFGVRRLTVPVPLGLIRIVGALARRVGREALRYDQIARLTCDKPFSIEAARRDLSFAPAAFAEGLRRLREAS
jgi:NADH dehydrogenase